MYKCWNCGTEHEPIAPSGASSRELLAEYNRGYSDAQKVFTQPTVSCGYPVEWKIG